MSYIALYTFTSQNKLPKKYIKCNECPTAIYYIKNEPIKYSYSIKEHMAPPCLYTPLCSIDTCLYL